MGKTGAFPLRNQTVNKGKNYRALGTCLVCGAVEIEVDSKGRCHLCRGDKKDDGVVPAFKKKDEEDDDTMYLN